MLSEESRGTEDWRNDAENSAFITGINYIFTYIQIKKLFCNYLMFFFNCIFDQINTALVSIRCILKKI